MTNEQFLKKHYNNAIDMQIKNYGKFDYTKLKNGNVIKDAVKRYGVSPEDAIFIYIHNYVSRGLLVTIEDKWHSLFKLEDNTNNFVKAMIKLRWVDLVK